jgi:hypothetical protein
MNLDDVKSLFLEAAEAIKVLPKHLQQHALKIAVELLLSRDIKSSPASRVIKTSVTKKKEILRGNSKKGPQFHISEMIDEGYFKKGRSIEDVRHKLMNEGYQYPQEDLGTPLRRLVQQKRLKREKVGSVFLYEMR